mgnify:FL=1
MPHAQAHRKHPSGPLKPARAKRWLQRAAKETLALGLLLMTQLSLLLIVSVVL